MASIKLKGDTSGEVIISAPSVAGNTTLELPATSSTLATQNSLGVRNLIINGDMRIAQRGTSATGVGVSTLGYLTVDRFRFQKAGSPTAQFTMTQDTDAPSGFSKSSKLEVTTADTSVVSSTFQYIDHFIEAQNLQYLEYGTSDAKKITLSFYVKCSTAQTFAVDLVNEDNSRYYNTTYSISSANTWERKTITFNGDTSNGFNDDNGRGLRVRWTLVAGSDYTDGSIDTSWNSTDDRATNHENTWVGTSGATFYITGVQLEVGTATPFEHKPYDMELQRCQRYYTNVYHNQFVAAIYEPNGDTRTQTVPIGTMRASPTLNPSSYSAHSINLGVSGNSVNTPTATWNLTVNHAGNNYYSIDTNQNGAVAYPSGTSVIIVGAHGVGTITCDAEL